MNNSIVNGYGNGDSEKNATEMRSGLQTQFIILYFCYYCMHLCDSVVIHDSRNSVVCVSLLAVCCRCVGLRS